MKGGRGKVVCPSTEDFFSPTEVVNYPSHVLIQSSLKSRARELVTSKA